jgi:hypothetical protein
LSSKGSNGGQASDSSGSYGSPPLNSKGSYGGQPSDSSGAYGSPPLSSKGSYSGQPSDSSGSYGSPPLSSKESYGGQPSDSSGSYGSHPLSAKGSYGGQASDSSDSYGSPALSAKGSYGGQPSGSSGSYDSQPFSSGGSHVSRMSFSSGTYGNQTSASDGSYGSQPSGSGASLGSQPFGSDGLYGSQPSSSDGSYGSQSSAGSDVFGTKSASPVSSSGFYGSETMGSGQPYNNQYPISDEKHDGTSKTKGFNGNIPAGFDQPYDSHQYPVSGELHHMQPSKIDGTYDNQAGSHGSSQSSLGEAYNSESGESLNIDSLMPHELHHRNNLIEATGLQENRHLQANKYHISKVSKADKEHSSHLISNGIHHKNRPVSDTPIKSSHSPSGGSRVGTNALFGKLQNNDHFGLWTSNDSDMLSERTQDSRQLSPTGLYDSDNLPSTKLRDNGGLESTGKDDNRNLKPNNNIQPEIDNSHGNRLTKHATTFDSQPWNIGHENLNPNTVYEDSDQFDLDRVNRIEYLKSKNDFNDIFSVLADQNQNEANTEDSVNNDSSFFDFIDPFTNLK